MIATKATNLKSVLCVRSFCTWNN